MFFFWVFALTGLIFSRKQPRPILITLFACTALLPLIASRHMPLFGLTCAVLTAEHVADVWDRASPVLNVSGNHSVQSLWFTAVSFVIALVVITVSLPNFQCIHMDGRKTEFPVKAVALLKQSNATGNMAVHFDWGSTCFGIWARGLRSPSTADAKQSIRSGPMLKIFVSRVAWAIGMESWKNLRLISRSSAKDSRFSI